MFNYNYESSYGVYRLQQIPDIFPAARDGFVNQSFNTIFHHEIVLAISYVNFWPNRANFAPLLLREEGNLNFLKWFSFRLHHIPLHEDHC